MPLCSHFRRERVDPPHCNRRSILRPRTYRTNIFLFKRRSKSTNKRLLPFRKRLFRVIQHLLPRFAPIYALRDFSPKTFRILQGFLVSLVVPRTGNVMGIDDVIYEEKRYTISRGKFFLTSYLLLSAKKATRCNNSERTNYR